VWSYVLCCEGRYYQQSYVCYATLCIHTVSLHIYIYIYIYIYTSHQLLQCVCVCVCVYICREREREREGGGTIAVHCETHTQHMNTIRVDKTRSPFSSKQVARIITTLFYRSKTHSKACLYQANACVTRTPPLSTRINNSNCPFYLRKKKKANSRNSRFDGVFIFARSFLFLCCQHHPLSFPSQRHNILLPLILVREE
jgi:hypothetical protein